MNLEIKTKKQPKKVKELTDSNDVAIIEKKDLFNGKPIEKKDLLMNITDMYDEITGEKIFTSNPIFAENYYVDSSGDIIKSAYIDGIKCVIVELCDKSLAEIETTNQDADIDTNIKNIKRVRINVATTDIDVCKVSLGTYRNFIQYNEKFINLNTKQKRVTYIDNRNKTVYESIIYCAPENKDAIISLIKQLNKKVIEWY